jgi:hypothetical protein
MTSAILKNQDVSDINLYRIISVVMSPIFKVALLSHVPYPKSIVFISPVSGVITKVPHSIQ